MGLELPQPDSNLSAFIEFLFGGIEGTAYVGFKDPNDPNPKTWWSQDFFQYPAEADRMERVILQERENQEVYIAPNLFKSNDARKENFCVSNVVWTEFDGNAPDEEAYPVSPSLRIQSSDETRQHVYWRLAEPVYDVETLESINKSITYALSADFSAWDVGQVLRPPCTWNYKRDTAVSIIDYDDVTYDTTVFDVFPKAPEGPDPGKWQLGSLPNYEDVLLKYAIPTSMAALLKKSKAEVSDGSGQRARSLVSLAYDCAEMGMSDNEIFVILQATDAKWQKFTGRPDREKRLAHIIMVARNKYPSELYGPIEDEDEDDGTPPVLNWVDFLNTEVLIDWAIEGMLMERGTMLMGGPSGIGKTQIALNMMIHLALGKDYLHYKISKPRKIMFFSLEMGWELQFFIEKLNAPLTEEERDLLRQNFHVWALGEPMYLNLPVGQQQFLSVLDDFKAEGFPTGVFVDSLGSCIKGNISLDESVQPLLEFNDKIKKKYGCFTWYIHHMRKATNGGHAPSTQDDFYGNQYLLNRSTSAYGMLRGRDGLIKMRNHKNRLAQMEQDYYIKRRDAVFFDKIEQDLVSGAVVLEHKQSEEDKGPTKFNY